MRDNLKEIFHIVLGIIFIIAGIVGLILPILNGILFLLLGFILLSFEIPYVESQLNKYSHKNAKIGVWYEKLNKWMRKIFGK